MFQYTGDEHFTFDGITVNKLLLDFWSWSSSNLLNDKIRGSLAEFIVLTALGLDTEAADGYGWEVFDILYNDIRIEVKCSSYLQAWKQKELTKPRFSIKQSSDYFQNEKYSTCRHSDVYVFCLYACKDAALSNPLSLDQWEFYIVPTKTIDDVCGSQKSISLQSLVSNLNPVVSDFENLKYNIDSMFM